VDLEGFEALAFELWEAIPARFREGVSAFVIEPGTYRKEEFEDGWVYGYCEPDEAIMAIPDAPVTSVITLFYGSFVQISLTTPDFDWEAELRETVRHELLHHLEWRAGVDHLGEEDDVQDDNERRVTGAPFRPDFHRLGLQLGPGVWLADDDLFIEVELRGRAWARLATEPCARRWGEIVASTPPLPVDLLEEDLLYVPADIEVVDAPPDVELPWRDVVLVLRRKRGWFW
jgi:hypothetical protein